ncbi:MAG: preprotein translocase subunit SecY [Pseudomonadota bacterium]
MRASGTRPKKADMSLDMSMLDKAGELKSRIGFVILALLIYRLGSFVPLPGIDPQVLKQLTSQTTGGMLEMFNMISGGSLSRMSLFALSIMPYITASIIFHLLSVMVPALSELRKSGESGRAKINQYTKYFTLLLAVTQSYGITSWLISMSEQMPLIVIDLSLFKIIAVSTLSAGTMLLMWLGDQINSRGIGNGISLIIFAGIVSSLPSSFISLFQLSRTGALSTIGIFIILGVIVGLFVLIVFVEKATRKIPISYPKKQVGNKIYGGDNTHMPLKLNTAGVIPPIFASSLLLFPQTLVNFFTPSAGKESVLAKAVMYLGHGKPLFVQPCSVS